VATAPGWTAVNTTPCKYAATSVGSISITVETFGPYTLSIPNMLPGYSDPHGTVLRRIHVPTAESPESVTMYRPGGMNRCTPSRGWATAYTPLSEYTPAGAPPLRLLYGLEPSP
jgi:hypothetical protein